MNELRETVLDTGPLSFVVLGLAAIAIALGTIACLLTQKRRSWKGLPGQLAVAAGALVPLALGLVIATTQARRSTVIRQVLQGAATTGDAANEKRMILGIQVQFAALVFIGALVLLALAVVSLGLALSWRAEATTGRRSPAWSRLRAVAVLVPALPVAVGLLLYGLRMNAGYLGVVDVDPAMKEGELLRSIDGAYATVVAARVGLLVLVALGTVAVVVASRRGPLPPSSSLRLPVSVLVFLAGLSAFAVTRGHAADRRPLPILPGAADASYASSVPRVSPCLPAESAPVLEFARDFVRLDWTHVDPNEFQLHFEGVRGNYALLHAGLPMPFLIVRADSATSIDRMIPYLQKVESGTSILVASASSHPVVSKTLGTIERYAFCGRTFRLTDRETATPLSRYRTWSDVAATISSASDVIEVTPW